MCCFFIHFHPVVPDMEKAGRKSRFQTVDKVLGFLPRIFLY